MSKTSNTPPFTVGPPSTAAPLLSLDTDALKIQLVTRQQALHNAEGAFALKRSDLALSIVAVIAELIRRGDRSEELMAAAARALDSLGPAEALHSLGLDLARGKPDEGYKRARCVRAYREHLQQGSAAAYAAAYDAFFDDPAITYGVDSTKGQTGKNGRPTTLAAIRGEPIMAALKDAGLLARRPRGRPPKLA